MKRIITLLALLLIGCNSTPEPQPFAPLPIDIAKEGLKINYDECWLLIYDQQRQLRKEVSESAFDDQGRFIKKDYSLYAKASKKVLDALIQDKKNFLNSVVMATSSAVDISVSFKLIFIKKKELVSELFITNTAISNRKLINEIYKHLSPEGQNNFTTFKRRLVSPLQRKTSNIVEPKIKR